MTKLKRILALGCAAALLTAGLSGCSKQKNIFDLETNPTFSIMTGGSQPQSADNNSPVVLALEEYIGSKLGNSNFDLDIKFIPTSGYDEKVVATLASGNFPTAMMVGSKTASIIQNARSGSFWDITDKITDASKYPNLAKSNEVVLNNTSIDGKIYGVYRARTLGRSGMSIREDWCEKVGLGLPTTIDEFYEVLKAFKEKDPDGNGKDDTFGMIMTTSPTTLNPMAIWFGAPNTWGEDENGDLKPAFMFDEYLDCLNFLHKCYEENLINQDFATYDGGKWDEQFLSSKAGVIIDVADRARRLAENMKNSTPDAKVGVLGYVKKDADSEPRTLPTTGYYGFYVFPTKSVVDEEHLDVALKVMDIMNDKTALDLMNFGIEGIHYTKDDEGYAVLSEDKELAKEYSDLNQVSTGIAESDLKKRYSTDVAEAVDRVYKDNENYVVGNPAEPLVSDTYSRKGPQLDEIMSTANTQFILGTINEEGYKAQIERWRTQGGDDYIEEINKAYKAIK